MFNLSVSFYQKINSLSHCRKFNLINVIFNFQQLFRSQNPTIAAPNQAAPNGGPPMPQALPLAAQQQFLAQAQAGTAYATQNATPYVINSGPEGPYVNLIPSYYGMAPWGMYQANLIPQQGAQPRRPLTPNQQTAAAAAAATMTRKCC